MRCLLDECNLIINETSFRRRSAKVGDDKFCEKNCFFIGDCLYLKIQALPMKSAPKIQADLGAFFLH
jgi:hypothetical protein